MTENGLWMGDQSIELWSGKSGWGSSENMADKQTRYSHVRLIENNDARVVVHWRYAITTMGDTERVVSFPVVEPLASRADTQ